MAAGDLITGDYELEYRGLLLGGDTVFSLVEGNGFLDLPEIISADNQLLRRDGLFPGDDFLGEREITLVIEIDRENADTHIDNLRQAFTRAVQEFEFVFQIPDVAAGVKLVSWARPRNLRLPITLDYLYGLPIAEIRLVATDPLFYSTTELSVSTTIATSGSGRSWPTVWPREWGTASESGSMSLTNSGIIEAPMNVRFDGPVSNPSIEDQTNGRSMSLDIDIADGDYIVIDTAQRSVLLNGTANRYSSLSLSNGWFGVAPGTNSFVYRGTTGGTGEVTVTWRSTWI